jgi:hypothetical protein
MNRNASGAVLNRGESKPINVLYARKTSARLKIRTPGPVGFSPAACHATMASAMLPA